MRAGEPFEIRAIAPSDQRRMEAGIFNYGNDMDITNNPFEVTGLERLVELDNDNVVVARDALERVEREGVTQKLVGVELAGEPLGDVARGLLAGRARAARAVGRLTSASFSPRLHVNMGYAWVPIELATRGTALSVVGPDGTRSATVVPLPFWDPEKAMPKA